MISDSVLTLIKKGSTIDQHLTVTTTDPLDDALAAKVLANMSAGPSSSTPPSPSVSSKAALPAPILLPPPNKHILRWHPTELIAQRPSLICPVLAEKLTRITKRPESTQAALEAALLQMDEPLGEDDDELFAHREQQ